MATPPDPERRSAEILSDADRAIAELAERVQDAKRERRRARRLRRSLPPTPEEAGET